MITPRRDQHFRPKITRFSRPVRGASSGRRTEPAGPTSPALSSPCACRSPRKPGRPEGQTTMRSSALQRAQHPAERPAIDMGASTLSDTPPRSTISISPSGWTGGAEADARPDDCEDGGAGKVGDDAAASSTAANCNGVRVTVTPCMPSNCWRHVYSCPELIRCLRATSVGVRSGPRLSATISRFCSAVHERLGSAQVRTSMRALRALL